MWYRIMVLALLCTLIDQTDVRAEERQSGSLRAATLDISAVTKRLEYNIGEQWVYTFKATVKAPVDKPLTLRAWKSFFADYVVIPELHGSHSEAKLSDVLATGGQIRRGGVPVVLWNSVDPVVFSAASKTVIEPGQSVSTTFQHDFGAAVKPDRFRQKLWFAVVVEPAPQKFMLLYSRKPIDVEFKVSGEEISFDTYLKRRAEWNRDRDFKLHTELPIREE